MVVSATGVVGLAAIRQLIWPLCAVRTIPGMWPVATASPPCPRRGVFVPVSQQKLASIANKFGEARLDRFDDT